MRHGWFSASTKPNGLQWWLTTDGRSVVVTLVTGNRRRPVRAPADLIHVGPVVRMIGVGDACPPVATTAAQEPATATEECCTATCCRAARELAQRLTRLHAR